MTVELMAKDVTREWFKGLEIEEVTKQLQELSNQAITAMQEREKDLSIKFCDILETKAKYVREYICECITPAYYTVNTERFNFWNNIQMELSILCNTTNDKMVEIFRANKMD